MFTILFVGDERVSIVMTLNRMLLYIANHDDWKKCKIACTSVLVRFDRKADRHNNER